MPNIKITVLHNLGQEEARNRIRNLVGDLKKQFGGQINDLQENWNDNRGNLSFKAMGMSIEADLLVEADNVSLNGNIPLTALPFKGRIESTIKDQLENLLS